MMWESLDNCLCELVVMRETNRKETGALPKIQNWAPQVRRETRRQDVISKKDNDRNIVAQGSPVTIMAAASREPAAGCTVVTKGLTAPSTGEEMISNVQKGVNVKNCRHKHTASQEKTTSAAYAPNTEMKGLISSTTDVYELPGIVSAAPAGEGIAVTASSVHL